jgi:hypothetical protein
MKTKKVLLFGAILMVAISSLGIASAGWFDFGGGSNPQNVSGIEFNIPGDFKEVNSIDTVKKNYKGMDVESKYFEFNNSDGNGIKVNDLAISVISGPNLTYDKIDKFTYSPSNTVHFYNSGDIDTLDVDKYNNTTIAGKSGLLDGYSSEKSGKAHYDFFYFEGDKLVNVELYGYTPFINSDQLEEILK